MKVQCLCCDKEFDKQISQVKKSPNNYCSRSCAAKINNKLFRKRNKKIKYCIGCRSIIEGNGKKYCSIKCQHKFEFSNKIEQWKIGKDCGYEKNGTVRRYIKKYLLQERGEKCEQCGWDKINPKTKKCPLEIHHMDGDYKNNKANNLQILCPNCHALTNTYKNMNKGNGREGRK
jgi:hypothetical protein